MKARHVLIPVVTERRGDDVTVHTALCRAWSEPTAHGAPARNVPSDADLRLAPVAAPLLNSGSTHLFDSGCTAIMAVRKLGLDASRWALWQWLRRYAWIDSRQLYAADTLPDLGHSAELGLALALLAPIAGFRGTLMATGSLTPPDEVLTVQGDPLGVRVQHTPAHRELRDTDAPVYAVAQTAAKLRRLAASWPGGSGGALCFTPIQDRNGDLVDTLPETRALRAAGIEVVPVASLGEAARRLECRRWPLLLADWAALTLLAILVVGAAFLIWRAWPIPLAFERGGGAAGYSEPFIACITPDERHTRPKALPRADAIARIGPGQKLAWTVKVGNAEAWDARLLRVLDPLGYYLLFAMVFADGTVELQDHAPAGKERAASPAFRAVPGEPWQQWVEMPITGAPGEHTLVVLARRGRPFDIRALRHGLDTLDLESRSDKINAAVNYLQAQAPGFLDFQLDRSDHAPDPCND